MRSASEIRARLLTELEYRLTRPTMYGYGQAFETAARSRLNDLAFIDARDEEFQAALRKHQDWWAHGAGVWGAFECALGGDRHFTDAIAAAMARLAASLGYFTPMRRLTPSEWDTDVQKAKHLGRCHPISFDAVLADLGTPSFRPEGSRPEVLGYAGPSDDAWLYVLFRYDEWPSQDSRAEAVVLPIDRFKSAVVHLSGGNPNSLCNPPTGPTTT